MVADALVFRRFHADAPRAAATVLAVAIAVATAVVAALATGALARAGARAASAIDSADTLHVFGDGRLLDERLVARIRALDDVVGASPSIAGNAQLTGPSGRTESVELLGIDLLHPPSGFGRFASVPGVYAARGRPFDPITAIARGAIIVTAPFARRTGATSGTRVVVSTTGRRTVLPVALVVPETPALGDSGVAYVDLSVAQALTGRAGFVDRIDVASDAPDRARRTIAALLPPDARVEATGAEDGQAARLVLVLGAELRVVCTIAFVLAGALTFETVSTGIVARRAAIATLRGLGCPRASIVRVLLAETAAYATAGALTGASAGWLAASHGTDFIDVFSDWPTLAIAVVSGAGVATLAGGFACVRLTRRESPAATRAAPDSRTVALGAWLAAAAALAAPLAGAIALASAFVPALQRGLRAERVLLGARAAAPRLAAATFRGLAPRVGVAAMSLALATYAVVALDVTMNSFDRVFRTWIAERYDGDLIVSYDGPAPAGGLPRTLVAAIRAAPGVARLAATRDVSVTYRGAALLLRGDDRATTASATMPLAERLHVRAGDAVALPTPSGTTALLVSSIHPDFADPGGMLVVPRRFLETHLHDTAADVVRVAVRNGAFDRARSGILRIVRDAPARVLTGAEMRDETLRAVEEPFALFRAVAIACFILAMLAVATVSFAVAAERRRSFATLRVLGASRATIRSTLFVEAVVWTSTASVAGAAIAVAAAAYDLTVADGRTFGIPLPPALPLVAIAVAIAGVTLGASLATLPAAWFASLHDGERTGFDR